MVLNIICFKFDESDTEPNICNADPVMLTIILKLKYVLNIADYQMYSSWTKSSSTQ